MEKTFDEHVRDMDTLCRFNRRFSFLVCNLYEIVSAQVINSRVDYYQPVDKSGYFWGQYEVQISYRRPKDRKDTQQKVFTHGFLINVPYSQPGISQKGQRKYTCEATCSYQIAPFLLLLFPLLSRIKVVPFKVVLDVTGRIIESTGETISGGAKCCCLDRGEECSCLENGGEGLCQHPEPEKFIDTLEEEAWLDQTWDGEGWEDKPAEAVNPVDDVDVEDKVKEEEGLIDLDLIALEKKEMLPNPDVKSTRSRGFDHYYNMLIKHEESIQQPQPKNKAPVGKAVGNKRQKKA